jgi:hypothetical protein
VISKRIKDIKIWKNNREEIALAKSYTIKRKKKKVANKKWR